MADVNVTSERHLDRKPAKGLDTLDVRRLSEAPGDRDVSLTEERYLTLVEAGLGAAKGRYDVELSEQTGTVPTERSWQVTADGEAGRAVGHLKVVLHGDERPRLTGEITLAVSGRAAFAGPELLTIGTRRLLALTLERVARQLEPVETDPRVPSVDVDVAPESAPALAARPSPTREGGGPSPSVPRSLVLAGAATMVAALVVWLLSRRATQ